MALTVATVGTRLLLPTKDGGGALYPAPVAPMPISPPLDAPVPPNPVTAPPPDGQIRGEGGTLFAVSSGLLKPLVYLQPYTPALPKPVLYATPEPEDFAPMAPVTPVPNVTPPAGTNANVKNAVLWRNTITGRTAFSPYDTPPDKSSGWVLANTPAKQPVPGSTAPVPQTTNAVSRDSQPGPITGKVAGFDLSRVPLWAWLVGAALVGAKLLK